MVEQPDTEHQPSPSGSTSPPDLSEPKPEQCLWQGRTHWKHFAGRIALWALASTLYAVLVAWIASRTDVLSATGACYIAGIPIVAAAVWVGVKLTAVIAGIRYRLTDERLFIERGLLTRTTDQTELIRVDDVRTRKTLIDRLFGLGSVELVSTDTSDRFVTLEGVTGADEVAEIVRGRMRALRRKSLFVESL
ncbi:MAG: PH domain-containing protein [Phycisphaerales bacterium]|nr:MAG: PH domain-containing protein [Phycisphaerales bacterium]